MKKLSQIVKLNEALDDGSYLQNYSQKTEVGKSFVAIHREMNATRKELEKDRLNSNTTNVATKTYDRSKDHMGYNASPNNMGDDLTKAFPAMNKFNDYRLQDTPKPADAYRLQDEETQINENTFSSQSARDCYYHHHGMCLKHDDAMKAAPDEKTKEFHWEAMKHHARLQHMYDQLSNHLSTAPHVKENTVLGVEGTTSESSVEAGHTEETMKPFKSFLEEASVTRKHFREVANTVRAVEDPAKRQELADHHAAIFKRANPNFSHEKFHEACGTHYRCA